MNTHYKFVSTDPQEQYIYNPNHKLYTFYQICQFKNPIINKYEVRKIIFNQLGEIMKTFEKGYPKKKLEIFMENNSSNKYALYPTTKIENVDLPNPNNILNAKSELLNS